MAVDEPGAWFEVTLRLNLVATDRPHRGDQTQTSLESIVGGRSPSNVIASRLPRPAPLRPPAGRGSLRLLSSCSTRQGTGLGDDRRRPHDPEPDRLRRCGQDDLHHQLHLERDAPHGRRAGDPPWRTCGRRPSRRVWPAERSRRPTPWLRRARLLSRRRSRGLSRRLSAEIGAHGRSKARSIWSALAR